MKFKTIPSIPKRNLSLLLGIVAGFSTLAVIAVFTIDAAAGTFVWVGVMVTIISSTLLTVEPTKKKTCSTQSSLK